MANRTVDHQERRRIICATALRLFAERGYAAVNLGDIAKGAGLSRPLLYTYYKDKRQIFNEAIDAATSAVGERHRALIGSKLPADEKLRQICLMVFDLLFANQEFVCVIVDFLCEFRKGGRKVPVENIFRHTIGLKRIFHLFILEAMRRGEYGANLNPGYATKLLYSQFEAAILRIAVSGGADITESVEAMNAILAAFKRNSVRSRHFL